MRKRPFLLLACMFLAGILARRYCVWALLPAALVTAAAIWRTEEGSRRGLLLACALFLLAAGALREGGEARFRNQYLPGLRDGQEVRLAGEVARVEEKSRLVHVYLTDCVLSSGVCCNDVLAYMETEPPAVGQVLIVCGKVSLFEGPSNEGGFDAKTFYQSQRIDFGLRSAKIEELVREPKLWQRALNGLRGRLAESVNACGGADGVLAAMLLGEKSGLDAEVRGLYQQAGISHILAISGLHVTLLGAGIYRLLRRGGLRYLSAGVVTASFMLCYGVMTGGSVPTRRAVGMLMVLLAGDVVGRAYDMLSALGLLIIVLLWENPFLTGYSGFWFSVLAVLGVGVAGPLLADWAAPQEAKERRKEGVLRLGTRAYGCLRRMLVSFGIQLATIPLAAYYYYEIPVYALFLNTIVLALVKYLLGIGCAAALAGMWSVRLGAFLMAFCNGILGIYERLCELTLRFPGASMITGRPEPWQIVIYYATISLVLFVLHRRTLARNASPKERRGSAAGTAVYRAAVTAVCTIALFAILAFRPAEGFELDVLDVGQGDGIFLRTEDGSNVFFDGGSSSVSAVGSYRILPFLKYNGVRRIDFWFVSHTDADHVSGLIEILESGYPVEYLLFADAVRREEKTAELAELAAKCGAKVRYLQAGDMIASETTVLRCLYPGADAAGGERDGNGLCLVVRLECAGFCGLFTGDIPAEKEAALLETGALGPVDFYKAAHHGSRHSNSEEFLRVLRPAVSVISCGRNNRYGHPGAEAVAHMEAAGSRVFRTDVGGQIRITLERGTLTVEEFCNGETFVVE